jgi:hypothetical protein
MADKHVFKGSEVIQASRSAVFQVLTDISQHYQQFALSTISIEMLTSGPLGKGSRWRETRRTLFLREDCYFTVTAYEEPSHYSVVMDDGANVVQYSFTLRDSTAPDTCEVSYCVECHTRFSSSASQPSERLARMMEKQDGALVKRLKQHIEAGHTVPVC